MLQYYVVYTAIMKIVITSYIRSIMHCFHIYCNTDTKESNVFCNGIVKSLKDRIVKRQFNLSRENLSSQSKIILLLYKKSNLYLWRHLREIRYTLLVIKAKSSAGVDLKVVMAGIRWMALYGVDQNTKHSDPLERWTDIRKMTKTESNSSHVKTC
jgi:hypothetical protein